MPNLKHEDVCTLLKNPEDKDILTRKLFDVNLRLMKTSPDYKSIVLCACEYIRELAMTEREGYKKPHGFSGANAGIPWNIIALADGTVMINPKIISNCTGSIIHGKSNCGSLLLPEAIEVYRWKRIAFTFWDRDLVFNQWEGYYPTVQHEIDHNNGILITDRKVENG